MTFQDQLRLHKLTLEAVVTYNYYIEDFRATTARYPTIYLTENHVLIWQFWHDFVRKVGPSIKKRHPYVDINALLYLPGDYP